MNEIEQRTNALESGFGLSLEELLKKLAELEDQLRQKVDKNEFDNHIMAIREMIGNIDHEEKAKEIKVQGAPSGSN